MTVEPGTSLGLVLPVHLSRHAIGLLPAVLGGRSEEQRSRIRASLALAPLLKPIAFPVRPLAMVGLPADWTPDALDGLLDAETMACLAAAEADLRTTISDAEAWERLGPALRARLSLAAAVATRRPLVVVPRAVAATIPEAFAHLERTGSHIILYGLAGRPKEGLLGAGLPAAGTRPWLVVSARRRVVAAGSAVWLEGRWDKVQARLDADRDLILGRAAAGTDDIADETTDT